MPLHAPVPPWVPTRHLPACPHSKASPRGSERAHVGWDSRTQKPGAVLPARGRCALFTATSPATATAVGARGAPLAHSTSWGRGLQRKYVCLGSASPERCPAPRATAGEAHSTEQGSARGHGQGPVGPVCRAQAQPTP